MEIQLDPGVDATSASVFGEATFRFTSRLSGTAGLRYTRERKDIDNAGGRYGLDPPMAAFPGTRYAYTDSIVYTAWTPKFGVTVKLPRNALTYVSATRVSKAEASTCRRHSRDVVCARMGVELRRRPEDRIDEGRARLDVVAFHTDYTNLQVQTPIAIGVFDIRNAAVATIRGIEMETKSKVERGFAAGGHAAWLDATYATFGTSPVAFGGRPGAPRQLGVQMVVQR